MDFLKDILGTELFEQVANAVNAYNGNEANKDKQIKIANLASGKYVDKGKYTALEELLNKKDTDLTDAQKLIEGLKESAGKGEDDDDGKDYLIDCDITTKSYHYTMQVKIDMETLDMYECIYGH